MMKLDGMKTEDKAFLIGTVLVPIITWWFFYGNKRYTSRGMK